MSSQSLADHFLLTSRNLLSVKGFHDGPRPTVRGAERWFADWIGPEPASSVEECRRVGATTAWGSLLTATGARYPDLAVTESAGRMRSSKAS